MKKGNERSSPYKGQVRKRWAEKLTARNAGWQQKTGLWACPTWAWCFMIMQASSTGRARLHNLVTSVKQDNNSDIKDGRAVPIIKTSHPLSSVAPRIVAVTPHCLDLIAALRQ